MKKIEKEKGIKTLDSEIQLVQMEKFVNNLDRAMNKSTRRYFKKLLYVLLPILASVGVMIVFPSPVMLVICMAVSIGVITVDQVKENKRMFKQIDQQIAREYNNVIIPEEEKEVEQILEEGIGKSEGKDFYTEKYQEAVNRVETESERKYRKALEQQRERPQFSTNIKLVDNQPSFLDKDETMIQVVKEIDAYYVAYKLPPLTISNNDWDIYFDTLYRVFAEKGTEDKFYSSMAEIFRFTFAKALVNKTNAIKIEDLIANLYYIQGGYGNYGMGKENISKKEILNIQKEIISKLQTPKIINFADYEKGRRK